MNKAFGKEKKGYKIKDVDAYIAEINAVDMQQKQRIADLKKELEGKDQQLKEFKQKQDLIVKSIVSAVQKAEQIEGLIKQKYTSEIAHLNAFHDQWISYYGKLIAAYPLSEELTALAKFNKRLTAILTGNESSEKKLVEANRQFLSESNRLSKNTQAVNQTEDQYKKEADRLSGGKKYVGFIPVDDTLTKDEVSLVPDFNPEESIRQMLRREALQEEQKAAKAAAKPSAKTVTKPNQKPVPRSVAKPAAAKSPITSTNSAAKSPVAATTNSAFLGLSDNGFSFEEALNPTQALSDILKEIGLDLTEK